ncbi:MAG: PQQ-dependent sugar dehydrogenase [Anaerolineae bacterium]
MIERAKIAVLLLLVVVLGLAACGASTETPAAGPVPSDTAAVTDTAEPTDTATATDTTAPTDTPVPGDTATPLPSETEQDTPAPTDSPTPTVTRALAPADTPTATPTAAPSATPTTAPTAAPTRPPDLNAVRLELQRVTGGLEQPVGIAHAGDGSGRLFVVEKPGRIRIVRDGALRPDPFLDISGQVGSGGSEQGLLGLAFHPRYAQNGLFFVNYTDRQGSTVVARFSVSGDPNRADPGSQAVILRQEQPAGNHNGGHLAFGPDGYLYIGLGDGGGAGDRYGNGQNGATFLGAMLRLDVDGGQPYSIPADNPFLDDPAVRDEIWAIGLRNPWRYSFDRRTGDLYIADVGQNVYEEVDVQPAGSGGGENYGWPIMEGQHCYPESASCQQQGLVLPVFEYDHTQGCSVTGGYVYRGQAFPLLRGIYVLGDYCSGRLWGLARDGDGQWRAAQVGQAEGLLTSFGEDEAGELYVVDMGGGALYRLVAREAGG